MEWVKIILEYFKVFLSTPVIAAILIFIFMKYYNEEIKALLKRLTKLPGGVELSTPQLEKTASEEPLKDKVSSEPQSAEVQIKQDEPFEKIKAMYQSERARAYFWEYSYLNYFLVLNTQRILSWINQMFNNHTQITLSLYDSIWMPQIPDIQERKAIMKALEQHLLITIDENTGLISITEKGREYVEWRSKVLNPYSAQ